jgi:hypothetical protein
MQHSLSIANQNGASFRGDLNNAIQSLATCSLGTTPPSVTYPCQWWIDTGTTIDATGGPWVRRRNSANSAWVRRFHADADLISELVGQAYTAYTTAGSSGAFTLTPVPAVAAYTAPMRYHIKFHVGGNGSDTISISGLGNKNLKQYDSSGNKVSPVIVAGLQSDIVFDGTDVVILDPLPASTNSVAPVVGTARNAKMSVATPSAVSTFTADEIIIESAIGGTAVKLSSYSQTINLATVGAGGMDTGAAPASGFVSLYAIAKAGGANPSILACAVATSSGSIYGGANMPSGYVASALIGVWPTNGSSQFIAGLLLDRYVTIPKVQAASLAGGSSPTTYTSLSISSIVPPNAKTVYGMLGSTGNTYQASAVAIDSNGTGEVVLIGYTSPGQPTIDGFYGSSCQFANFPMATAQTIYYKCSSSTISMKIDINGYTF